jgi:peptide/nickel transport system substrate-binding protein
MFQESSPFYDAKYNFPEPDAVQAQKLFDELAAANGGQPLTFTMAVSTNTANKARVTQLQTQLLKFKNVKAELKVIDGPQYGTALFAGDFNMALYAIASPDPEPQFAQLSSTYFVKIADMKSAAGDAALLAGVQATDIAGRKVAYNDLQQALLDTYAEIWMYRNIVRAIYSPDTTGLVTYGQGSHLFDQYGLVE